MTITPSRIAAVAVVFLLAGCGASMQPLKTTEAPRSISAITPVPHKIPVPITIKMFAADNPPTTDGQYTYPLKQYLEKAFKDAMGGAFKEGEDAYTYTLEVTANSAQLTTTRKKGLFEANFTSVLRGPDNRVRGDAIPYRGSIESSFDRKQVPESVWDVAYKASKEVLEEVRRSHWYKADLQDLQSGVVSRGGASAVPQMAAQSDEQSKPAAKIIRSDVDTPSYQVKENPDNYALVIGVEKYQNIPDATFAEHDAVAVKENLLALGYPERNIIMMTNDHATKSKLVAYLEQWLPRNLTENSRLFVYYSGHGAPDPESKEAYILPWDADPKFLESSAYSIKDFYAKLNALPAKNIMVAMDSCFSGAGGRSVIAEGTRPLVPVNVSKVPDKLTVFAAASAEETTGAKNDQGHGLFTYYFLKGLGGEATNRKTGGISSKDLFTYLKTQVQNAASRDNRPQTPQLMGSSAADAQLIRSPD